MNELEGMTQEELEAILGSDYETLIADALRRKEGAEVDPSPGRNAGQMGNGHVAFDPGYAIEKYANRYRQSKDKTAAQGDLDKALSGQTAGRKTYANALLRQGAPSAPMTTDINAGPPKPPMPPAPPPQASPMGAPPAPPAPAPPPQPPAALGPMPSGEPLRGPPNGGAARPPMANAQGMDPAALQAAGVPPEVLVELLRKRGGM